jgi:ABC-type dipeptide/oligopeptide/nickel transport system permease component
MEQKMFDWLKNDIEKVDAKVDNLGLSVNNKLDVMGSDVKQMLEFKWQIIGGSVVISAIVGIVLQIIIAVYGRT